MGEKRNTLLEYQKALLYIKELSSSHEYKDRVGGEELGIRHANRGSTLHSPQNGVPIKKDKDPYQSRKLIRILENGLGLTSWVDNI